MLSLLFLTRHCIVFFFCASLNLSPSPTTFFQDLLQYFNSFMGAPQVLLPFGRLFYKCATSAFFPTMSIRPFLLRFIVSFSAKYLRGSPPHLLSRFPRGTKCLFLTFVPITQALAKSLSFGLSLFSVVICYLQPPFLNAFRFPSK